MISPPTVRLAALACVLWCALANPACAATCSKAITMGTGHWEPYAYYDAQRRFTGIDADMARAIFKEAGCVLVEMAQMPATRNMTLFEQAGIDMMSGATLTPERLKIARFSVAYRDETVGIFMLADGAARYRTVHSFDDFLDQPLALLAPKVGWYGLLFERHAEALHSAKRLSRFGDYSQGIRMLAAGRADFMLGDAAGVEHAAARLGVKVQPLPFWMAQAPVHMMFNRATVREADVRRIDAAIARLQRRGEFERIRRTYGGS
ncbi:MAG: transporter substrate-binding domain-containing protein [Pseudomonadota bacterium]